MGRQVGGCAWLYNYCWVANAAHQKHGRHICFATNVIKHGVVGFHADMSLVFRTCVKYK